MKEIIEIIEIIEILLNDTTFTTVLSGVLVYVISQAILELYIKPKRTYKELKKRIIYSVELYSCYFLEPYNLLDKNQNQLVKEQYDEASREMRKIGAELAGYIGTVSKCKKDKIKRLEEVKGAIIGISNNFFITTTISSVSDLNSKRQEVIKKNL